MLSARSSSDIDQNGPWSENSFQKQTQHKTCFLSVWHELRHALRKPTLLHMRQAKASIKLRVSVSHYLRSPASHTVVRQAVIRLKWCTGRSDASSGTHDIKRGFSLLGLNYGILQVRTASASSDKRRWQKTAVGLWNLNWYLIHDWQKSWLLRR